jgi:hypothetical protein
VSIYLRRYRDHWGAPVIEVRSDGLDEEGRPVTLARVGYQIVAATLAEPLRKAFAEHLAAHEHPDGFGHCEEAMRLFRLLPESEQIILASAGHATTGREVTT